MKIAIVIKLIFFSSAEWIMMFPRILTCDFSTCKQNQCASHSLVHFTIFNCVASVNREYYYKRQAVAIVKRLGWRCYCNVSAVCACQRRKVTFQVKRSLYTLLATHAPLLRDVQAPLPYRPFSHYLRPPIKKMEQFDVPMPMGWKDNGPDGKLNFYMTEHAVCEKMFVSFQHSCASSPSI